MHALRRQRERRLLAVSVAYRDWITLRQTSSHKIVVKETIFGQALISRLRNGPEGRHASLPGTESGDRRTRESVPALGIRIGHQPGGTESGIRSGQEGG